MVVWVVLSYTGSMGSILVVLVAMVVWVVLSYTGSMGSTSSTSSNGSMGGTVIYW